MIPLEDGESVLSSEPHTKALPCPSPDPHPTVDGQEVEVQVARKILNTMTPLGMPNGYWVA